MMVANEDMLSPRAAKIHFNKVPKTGILYIITPTNPIKKANNVRVRKNIIRQGNTHSIAFQIIGLSFMKSNPFNKYTFSTR